MLLPADSHLDYQDMLGAGCELHAEILSTKELSVTISDGEQDVDIELFPSQRTAADVSDRVAAMLARRQWRDHSSGVRS